MTQLCFLSGLPRTGSTVLAAILNQHPDVHASATSPLMDFLCLTDQSLASLRKQYVMDSDEQDHNVYQAILNSFYAHVHKPVVFDKHRAWPKNAPILKRFIKHPKIVCTVRPVAEIIASYIAILIKHPYDKNVIDRRLIEQNIPLTIANRAKLIWEGYVQDPHQSMLSGLQHSREHILCVSYASIVHEPEQVLRSIFEFTGIRAYGDFNFSNLRNITPEKDEDGWGFPGLHSIRPELRRTSVDPSELLGPELSAYFRQFDLPL